MVDGRGETSDSRSHCVQIRPKAEDGSDDSDTEVTAADSELAPDETAGTDAAADHESELVAAEDSGDDPETPDNVVELIPRNEDDDEPEQDERSIR